MAFRWLNKMGVESDDGFVVQFIGRFSLEYRESGRVLKLYVENGRIENGLRCQIIDPTSVVRWDGPLSEAIPEEEKSRIFGNIARACEFQGLKLVLDSRKFTAEAFQAMFPSSKIRIVKPE